VQLWLGGAWFCLAYFYFFNVLGYVFESTVLILAGTFIWIAIAYFVVLMLDSLSQESVDPLKIWGATVISTFMGCTAWTPDAISYFNIGHGVYGWDWGGTFKIACNLMFVFVALLFFYYCVKIFKNSPKRLKRDALILLLGSILASIIPVLIVITNISLVLLGIEAITQGIGLLLIAYEFAHHPQLAFVLPFKITSLTVMNSKTGLPLYTHSWDKTRAHFDETLFSGMIYGIGGILKEATHQGEVREVRMSQGILLLHHLKQLNLAFVLVTTKTASILHNALDSFAHDFVKQFSDVLDQVDIVDRFNEATELIHKYFSFVPELEEGETILNKNGEKKE
jgi:hypothetical protein